MPFVISGASMASIESVARFSPQRTWYQVYPARDPAITAAQVESARDAGCAALVLTVDTPVLPKRERDMRNGMGLPFHPPLPLLLEALTHPAWIFAYLRNGGMPMMQSWAPYAPAGCFGACSGRIFPPAKPDRADLARLGAIPPQLAAAADRQRHHAS